MQKLQGSSATVHALASVWANSSCLSLPALMGTWIPLPRVVMVQRAVAPSVVVKGAEKRQTPQSAKRTDQNQSVLGHLRSGMLLLLAQEKEQTKLESRRKKASEWSVV